MSYGYDAAGNLKSKTDNRNITTTLAYDSLNRLRSQLFSDGTPTKTYTYDGAGIANGIGQLTSVSNANAVQNFSSFDAVGNVKASNQVTAGQTYSFAYSYNLAGQVTSETYPSGRVISESYDAANRPSSLTGVFQNISKTYLSNMAYWPHNAVYYYTRGNSLWHAASYNNRLQPTEGYEAVNNSSSQMLFVSCPNWGVNTNVNVYDLCPHAAQTNDNGTMQSYSEVHSAPGNPGNRSQRPKIPLV